MPDILSCVGLPRFTFIATLLAVVLGSSACGNGDVAADVKGSAISNAQVTRLEPALRLLVEAQGGSCDPAAPPPQQGASPPPPGVKGRCDVLTLEELVKARLVKQYAIDNKIAASATDVNEFMNQMQTALGGSASATGAQTTVNTVMADKGVSMESMRELAQTLVLLSKVAAYMDAHVSDETLKNLYEENRAQFATFDSAHILVATEAEAQKILAQATTDNFAELAKKYSTDKGSAVKGGDLGSVQASQFVPEFSNAVMAAQPGQIIGPVKSQFGYHVIWVKKLDIKSFEQAKDQIKKELTSSAAGATLGLYVVYQLKSGEVTINPRYGRLDPQTGAIVPVGDTAGSPGASVPSP